MSGRLLPLTPSDLDESQRTLYDLIANEIQRAEHAGVRAKAPDGALLGPFNPLLFSPLLATAQVGLFRADQLTGRKFPKNSSDNLLSFWTLQAWLLGLDSNQQPSG